MVGKGQDGDVAEEKVFFQSGHPLMVGNLKDAFYGRKNIVANFTCHNHHNSVFVY